VAGRTGLTVSLVLALAVHWASLDWLSRQLQAPTLLQTMTAPLLTRALVAQTAPQHAAPVRAGRTPVSGKNQAPALANPAQPAIPLIAKSAESAPASTPTSTVTAVVTEAVSSTTALVPDDLADHTSTSTPTLPAMAPALPTALAATPLPAATAFRWTPDTRLAYQLKGWFRGEFKGDARVNWQREGARYQVRLDIDIGVLANVRMTSQGEVHETGLRPTVYEESRLGKVRQVRLGTQDITLDDGRRVPRPDGVQDTASQFVELSHQFANGLIRLAKGTVVSFSMARPGGVDAWVYDVTERVVLDTPGYGPVEAFHLVPRPQAQPRGNITAEMWFAPSLQYLPVKIRIQQGNEIHMDLVVERIDQAETKPGS